MFQVGDKVTVAINANDADGNPVGQRFVPQRIVSQPNIERVIRRSRFPGDPERAYNNPIGAVIAMHPVTGVLYYRPAENLQFAYPRSGDVVGLDIDEDGKPIGLDALVQKVQAQNAERLAANPRRDVVSAPVISVDLTALNAQHTAEATLADAEELGVTA